MEVAREPLPEAVHETYVSVYAPIVYDGRALLALNQQGPYQGTWNLVGGGVEFGEDPEEAIRREVWEETGGTVTGHRLVATHSNRMVYERVPGQWIDFHHIALLYRVELDAVLGETVQPPDSKERVVWHELATLTELPLSPSARFCFENRGLLFPS